MKRAALMLTAATCAAAMTAFAQAPAKKQVPPPPNFDAATPAAKKQVVVQDAPKLRPVNAVEQALEQPTFLDFNDTQLSQALSFAATQHKIPIHVSETGLMNAMVDKDAQVNLKLTNVRFATALDLLLEPLNLDYYVVDSVMVVTSAEDAANRRSAQLHRIGDLVPDGEETMESLADLIRTCVDRDAWVVNGGEAEIRYVPDAKSFVINAPDRLQRKVRQLLTDLRQAKRANGMP